MGYIRITPINAAPLA
ncbi:poxvirus D5 -like family protein, partial [Yersinia pestis PY-34]